MEAVDVSDQSATPLPFYCVAFLFDCFLLVLPGLLQVEGAYQQHLMRGEATEELLQMGQTNAALDILAQK